LQIFFRAHDWRYGLRRFAQAKKWRFAQAKSWAKLASCSRSELQTFLSWLLLGQNCVVQFFLHKRLTHTTTTREKDTTATLVSDTVQDKWAMAVAQTNQISAAIDKIFRQEPQKIKDRFDGWLVRQPPVLEILVATASGGVQVSLKYG
jgi:hypothetical protein